MNKSFTCSWHGFSFQILSLFLAASFPFAQATASAQVPTFEQASKLFEEGKTGDAGVALEAYAGQRPSPPRRAEALLLLGRCHERRRDFAKARRQFEQITQDGVMRRKEPGAVAEAYDRLHALLVSQGASALTRRRVVDAARRDIRESEAFSHICEREGDALVIAGDMRGALASYEAAPAISEAGESVRGLLKAGFASSRKISDSDIAALSKVAKSKADLVRPLCMALSKCREGWMAEDFLASHCLSNGKGDEAAKIWKDMLRRKAGPADAIAYSHCEALAATNPKSAIAELDKWLASHADSPLAEKALLVQARLEAAHGDKERAATLFEQYLAGHPQGKLVDVARNGLDEVRQSMARQAEQKARETERAEARRNNPDMAKVEAAEALLNQRRYREAAREFNALSHSVRQPLRDRVLLGLGEALRGQEDYQGAIAALNSIVRNASSATNAPITAKAHRAIGDILLEDTGDHAKALSAYEKSLSFQPDIDDSGFWMNY
ncbi:MAG: tetratricopeptide repeat protein, partial [Kiritimatiellae bacterium]|nr:tetratricopeptide repeat protein [Kiritimatiellia bacterium]